MALVNEIQVGRLNAILHKLLSMKEGAPSPVIAPELVGAIVLETEREEWKFLGGEIPWGFPFSIPATVNARVKCQVRNPPGSGTLAVITRIGFNCSAQAGFRVYVERADHPDLTTVLSGPVARDVRQASNIMTTTPLVCSFATDAVPPAYGASLTGSNSGAPSWPLTDVLMGCPIVLVPGSLVLTDATFPNGDTQMVVFMGYARTLEPSETR